MTNREYIYRSAYELGRHVIGYEVQKSLALVDWIERINGAEAKVAIVGYGEGGMLAMYAAAVDTRGSMRLSSAVASGHASSFGKSPSIATCSVCLSNLAARNWRHVGCPTQIGHPSCAVAFGELAQ